MSFVRKHRGEAVCNIGKETSAGEAAASTVTFPFVGDGMKPEAQNQHAEIMASSTHPYTTKQVETGRVITTPFEPYVHAGTLRDIIEMARPQSGVLPTFTLELDNMGVDAEKHAGCVIESLELTFARQGGGGSDFALKASQQWRLPKALTAGTVTRTTEPAGNEFLMNLMTATVNGVGVLDVLAWTYRRNIAWAVGPADENYDALYLVPGPIRDEFELRAAFDAHAWRSLIMDRTNFSGVFVLATGTANETVTLTAAQCKGQSHGTERGEDEVTETLRLVTQGPSGSSTVAVAYGTAIGASRLSLGA